jgi:ferredoxin-NADP reductase
METCGPDGLGCDTDGGVLDLRVEYMCRESDRVMSLLLRDPDGRVLPAWAPGAHIDVRLNHVVRQYSLCGRPDDRLAYRIAVLREERSRGGSVYVHDKLRPGDIVKVGGPRNNFKLDDYAEYLFIAGGIGITPILPMVAAVANKDVPWRLFYGARTRGSLAFCGELARYGGNVQVMPEDKYGLLDLDAIVSFPRQGLGIYVCGPEGLLRAAECRCERWPPDALHLERFQPTSRPDPAGETGFVVLCHRSGREVTVPPGVTLLEALEAAGIHLTNACREGICGSCQVGVLDGAVKHRDSVLSAREREDNKWMMACVSRAASDRLILDV